MSPNLFIISINDITQILLISVLFADDAIFYAQYFTTQLAGNRLIAYESKTKCMLVTPRHHPRMPNDLINCNVLEWAFHIKYRGFILYNKLNLGLYIVHVL